MSLTVIRLTSSGHYPAKPTPLADILPPECRSQEPCIEQDGCDSKAAVLTPDTGICFKEFPNTTRLSRRSFRYTVRKSIVEIFLRFARKSVEDIDMTCQYPENTQSYCMDTIDAHNGVAELPGTTWMSELRSDLDRPELQGDTDSDKLCCWDPNLQSEYASTITDTARYHSPVMDRTSLWDSSQTLSPISPCSLRSNMRSNIDSSPGSLCFDRTVSPSDTSTPMTFNHQAVEHTIHTKPSYQVAESLVVRCFTDASGTPTQGTTFISSGHTPNHSEPQYWVNKHHATLQQPFAYELYRSKPPEKTRKIDWAGYDKSILGSWEATEDSTWHRCPRTSAQSSHRYGVTDTSRSEFFRNHNYTRANQQHSGAIPVRTNRFVRERQTGKDCNNAIPCKLCDQVFTGRFASGNRTRHVKLKHLRVSEVICCICRKTYQRKDALLKHLRKDHSIVNNSV
jgi:hypothetical protein